MNNISLIAAIPCELGFLFLLIEQLTVLLMYAIHPQDHEQNVQTGLADYYFLNRHS